MQESGDLFGTLIEFLGDTKRHLGGLSGTIGQISVIFLQKGYNEEVRWLVIQCNEKNGIWLGHQRWLKNSGPGKCEGHCKLRIKHIFQTTEARLEISRDTLPWNMGLFQMPGLRIALGKAYCRTALFRKDV